MIGLDHLLAAPRSLRRTVALALVFLVIASVAALAWSVADHLSDRIDILSDKRLRLGRLQAAVRRMETVRLETDTSSSAVFLSAGDDALVTAELQTWISGLAASHEVAISSIGPAPVRTVRRLKLIGLKASITGSYENVVRFISAVETAETVLVVESFDLHAAIVGIDTASTDVSGDLQIIGVAR